MLGLKLNHISKRGHSFSVNLISALIVMLLWQPLFGDNISFYKEADTTMKSVHQRDTYREISNISRTKSEDLNFPRLVMQLSLYNILKPGVKSRMKMQLEQRRQAMFQLHLSDRQFYCLLRCV